ncbi:MAG: 16S rRNA (cytidine(1402)-2'-O)-methyltransferase [Thermotogaceae bacterium]|nr:16S rRNA (cytidine(1402)-2'-O)-methyltransferase [Thermotogaceae bacterium]
MSKLYLVATPIGNLEDVTLRAIKVLRSADLLIVEDKRRTVILLNKYNIGKKKMVSIAERSPEKKIDKIMEMIIQTEISCLLSDAGMPVISDPGRVIVERCWKEGVEIDVVPGPSAVISAIAASGFQGSKFSFLGFLPRGKKRRRLLKDKLLWSEETIVFFESPNRLLETLRDILDIVGDIEIFVAREMTKIHQEFFKGKVSEVMEHYSEGVKGEITVVIEKKREG